MCAHVCMYELHQIGGIYVELAIQKNNAFGVKFCVFMYAYNYANVLCLASGRFEN